MTRLVRLAAATALVAAAGLAGPTPAAYAAACSSGSGVSVVVDFHELGGGLQQVCDAGGGGQKAASLFPDNGFPLDYVQQQPGFVCRVSGAPADDPCVRTPPADAYWGLWWSDGDSGTWSYATSGVASLTIPEGGSVALSWNGSSTKSPPGAPPPQHDEESNEAPEPETTASPTKPPGEDGEQSQTDGPSAATSTTGSPPASTNRSRPGPDDSEPRKGARGRDRGDREVDDEPSATESPSPGDEPTSLVAEPPTAVGDDAGLPVWVGPTAVGGLLGAVGVAAYLRRRVA